MLLLGKLDLLVIILIIGIALNPLVSAQRSLYERKFRYKKLSILEATSRVGGHVFSVIGAMLGLGAIVLYIRPVLWRIGTGVGLYSVDGFTSFDFHCLSIDEWKSLIDRIRGFWTERLGAQSFNRLIMVLTGAWAGETAAGYFYQARKLINSAGRLTQPLTFRIFFNHLSRNVREHNTLSVLVRVLTMEGMGLLSVGAVVYAWADPLIPIVLGADWSPVVPLFKAMGGVFIFGPLLRSVKAYYMNSGRLQRYIIWGHGTRYVALGIAAGIIFMFKADPALILSATLSAAFLGAFVLSLVAARRGRRSSHCESDNKL